MNGIFDSVEMKMLEALSKKGAVVEKEVFRQKEISERTYPSSLAEPLIHSLITSWLYENRFFWESQSPIYMRHLSSKEYQN